jgi:hypothetical protein
MPDILLTLLVYAVIFGAVFLLIYKLDIPEPWKEILKIAAVVISVLFTFSMLFSELWRA